jgi:hypothetical protein
LRATGGPVEQQSGFRQAEAGAGGFQSGGGQGASEPAEALINDLLRDAAQEAQVAEAGVAAKFLGRKTDGFEDLWFRHGDALSSKRSFGHFFPFGKRKATHLKVNPDVGGGWSYF